MSEILITNQMMIAGANVLARRGVLIDSAELARSVFLAMTRAAPGFAHRHDEAVEPASGHDAANVVTLTPRPR